MKKKAFDGRHIHKMYNIGGLKKLGIFSPKPSTNLISFGTCRLKEILLLSTSQAQFSAMEQTGFLEVKIHSSEIPDRDTATASEITFFSLSK